MKKALYSHNFPEIRIQDAWLIRVNVSVHLHELWAKDGQELADDDWMERKVKEYQKAWKPYEKKILTGLYETLDLKYRQNIIDVYIAPWFNAFSDPMVIGVMMKSDVFVDTLTHELIHRLLTDNLTIPYQTGILMPEWQKLFGKKHTFTTLVHIPVLAVHKAIYLDVLNEPERYERDVRKNKEYKATDYIKAWEYVDKNGYKEIINKLRDSYTELAEVSLSR